MHTRDGLAKHDDAVSTIILACLELGTMIDQGDDSMWISARDTSSADSTNWSAAAGVTSCGCP
jgi:hypothetical protein